MKCNICGKPMNPVDAMMGRVCLTCTKKLHAEATGAKKKHG